MQKAESKPELKKETKPAPAKPAQKAESKPEPKKETKPAPAKPVQKAESKPEPKKETKPAPTKPVQKAESKSEPQKEVKPAPISVVPDAKEEQITTKGKWIITKKDGKFSFELRANNGEVMLTSSAPYSSLTNAKAGIETYKKNIEHGNFTVVRTKGNDFIFQLFNARGSLLANGSAYSTEANCKSAVESTKRWAAISPVEIDNETL